MNKKIIGLIGIILFALVLVNTILSIVNAVKTFGYFDKAQEWIDANKASLQQSTQDKIGVENSWTSYVIFILSPVELLIIGFFNWTIYKNNKGNSRISTWPLIVIIVFAVIAIIVLIMQVAGSNETYSIKNLADIKKDSPADYKKIVDGIKPIFNKNTVPAVDYIGWAISIVSGAIAIPVFMSVRRLNNN